MDILLLEQGLQDLRNEPLIVETVPQKTERAVAECVKRSEVQMEQVRVNKRVGDVEASLNTINARLELLARQFAELDKNTKAQRAVGRERKVNFVGQNTAGQCRERDNGSHDTGGVFCDGDGAAVLGEGKGLPFARTPFTGTDMETMTKGVNPLKHWTWLSKATLVNDSNADPLTRDGLFDGI